MVVEHAPNPQYLPPDHKLLEILVQMKYLVRFQGFQHPLLASIRQVLKEYGNYRDYCIAILLKMVVTGYVILILLETLEMDFIPVKKSYTSMCVMNRR